MQHEIVLTGYGFSLVPLSQAHVGALAKIVDPTMWMGMATPTPEGEVGMANYIEDAISARDVFAFAVIDIINGDVCGSTAFCGVDREQGRLEIGRTFYDRSLWGRVINPACKFLTMEYAFETWGTYRVAMRADSRNVRSINAITRLGATYEGTLRGFRVAPDGSRCDSMSFSILFPEWPVVRDGLLDRIDPLRNVSQMNWGPDFELDPVYPQLPNESRELRNRAAGNLVNDGAGDEQPGF